MNDHKFAKVSSAKILCSILNNIIKVQICQSLFCQLCFCIEFAKVCTHQSFPLYGMHVTSGKLQHFNQQLTPRLQQILKGIQKDQAGTHPPKVRLPIMLQILQDIKRLLSGKPQSYTNIMSWAACCLAFFGFLRVSGFTIPSQEQYDQSCHLSLGDASLDNRDTPCLF